ncbi:L-arabinose transport system permease protein AraQ [Paenibacillus konkukensis]|uniref:L-arabinose transport system permease protein AraQ n=1 Tax=Paenibacillus konkukensis TaxID=2020716 RepID=A0ABY4RJT2_9BACL|nr:carbohydrate ABC transporter permease [Paenibacillus konkukensis]UQZ82719.1 L-arabinose transport system permease protein AraQ [Paenibacillus konkukensis]
MTTDAVKLQSADPAWSILSAVKKSALWIFLLLVALLTLFPVVIALLGSFKSNAELTGGATILPQAWHFNNYAEVWQQAHFSTYTWNSLFISSFATVGTLIVASMAAYAVDRLHYAGKRFYVALQAATMFVSIGAVVLRPQFELMVKLHMHTSLWGVIIILISGHASIFFILLSFVKAIPRELDEAAMIDGCSKLWIYTRIIFPLLKPGLGVAALFTFRGAWNEYILPLVFTMSQPKLQVLTVGLAGLRYGISAAAQTHYMMAGACLSILPLLIVYVLANKSFMQVTSGSVKG